MLHTFVIRSRIMKQEKTKENATNIEDWILQMIGELQPKKMKSYQISLTGQLKSSRKKAWNYN